MLSDRAYGTVGCIWDALTRSKMSKISKKVTQSHIIQRIIAKIDFIERIRNMTFQPKSALFYVNVPAWKWLWGAQNLCFGDLPFCLCGPRKNFSCELPTPNMYCKTSLWSYLHAEMNGVSFGYFNAMICPQTWADGTFLDFIPSQRRLEGKLDWKKLRQLCVLGGVFEIQTALEFFLDIFTSWCGYLKSSLRVGLYVEEKIRVIRHSNQKLSTKTQNWL